MPLRPEMRDLKTTYDTHQFPKHLEYLEISNIRGWTGQRIEFNFPIVAIVGENGTGKSTIIQAAASIYKGPNGDITNFASKFFPDTAWERLQNVEISGVAKEGTNHQNLSVRKPTNRWRGNEDRRVRHVRYLDLKRILPIYSKTGYSRLAKGNLREAAVTNFGNGELRRLTNIIGKNYVSAKQATTNADARRPIPVLRAGGGEYSGFHQGAGETSISELLTLNIPRTSLVLIDEIEASLHPRAQRRLMRDLATFSRVNHVQFILTTHSPYILEELPDFARIQIINDAGTKRVIQGVSPEFALSQMDDINHPEMDVYVEDRSAKILVEELIAAYNLPLLSRVKIIPFGAANVGQSLGIMNSQNRFPNRTIVALDGDQQPSPGCMLLPGGGAPERVIFAALAASNYPGIALNISRDHNDLTNQAGFAMTLPDHHEWVRTTATNIATTEDELWRSFCRSWVNNIYRPANPNDAVVDAIRAQLL